MMGWAETEWVPTRKEAAMRETMQRIVDSGAEAVAVIAGRLRDTPGGRAVRHTARTLTRRGRYARGRLDGMRYRLAGRVPKPGVSDEVLADRLRSSLGSLEKRLDIPRVHVQVDRRFVVLHGDVESPADAEAVERLVRHAPGVRGVESYLHVGLQPGSTRPSAGRARAAAQPSPALEQLLTAARDTGAHPDDARRAVRAVLGTFAERVPIQVRRHVFSHLPDDVRCLALPPRRHGTGPARLRTVPQLVVAAACNGLDPVHADAIAEAVLGRLRELVPEEVVDVAAVLPEDLRHFWLSAVPG